MRIDSVVKLGGGVLADAAAVSAALQAIAAAATTQRLLVVPGGGPFADVVRVVDKRMALTDAASHWMAVLAMDQYAEVVVDRLPGAMVVRDRAAVHTVLATGGVPVLAPSQWLRAADPLPHSWDVTSDSIAAWVAGEFGAARLVLIKPPGSAGELVDPYFPRAVRPGTTVVTIAADQIHERAHLR